MITKGEIQSVDYTGNTCVVRIPYFESAGITDRIYAEATVCNPPGIYNSYKAGDVVFLAFDDGEPGQPVILGKLFLGASKEQNDPRGVINAESSLISKNASLPLSTKLVYDQSETTAQNGLTKYNSIADIANKLADLTKQQSKGFISKIENRYHYGESDTKEPSDVWESWSEVVLTVDESDESKNYVWQWTKTWTKTIDYETNTFIEECENKKICITSKGKNGTSGRGIKSILVVEYYKTSEYSDGIALPENLIGVPKKESTDETDTDGKEKTDETETAANENVTEDGETQDTEEETKTEAKEFVEISDDDLNEDIKTIADDGWFDKPQITSDEKKYLWNFEMTVYTFDDDKKSVAYTDPVIIGTKGDAGENGTDGVDGVDGVTGTLHLPVSAKFTYEYEYEYTDANNESQTATSKSYFNSNIEIPLYLTDATAAKNAWNWVKIFKDSEGTTLAMSEMFKTLGYYSLSANDLIAEDRNENSGKCLTLSGCSGRSMESNTRDTLAGGWAAIAAYKNTNAEKNTLNVSIQNSLTSKYGRIEIKTTDGSTTSYIYDYDEDNDPSECYETKTTDSVDNEYIIINDKKLSTTYLDIKYAKKTYVIPSAMPKYEATCTLSDVDTSYLLKIIFTKSSDTNKITESTMQSKYLNNNKLKISSTETKTVEEELKTATAITLIIDDNEVQLNLVLINCDTTTTSNKETEMAGTTTTVSAKYLVYSDKLNNIAGLKYHEVHTINKISAGNITAIVLDADNKLKQIFVKEEENEESHSIIGDYIADTKYYYIARNNNSDKSWNSIWLTQNPTAGISNSDMIKILNYINDTWQLGNETLK